MKPARLLMALSLLAGCAFGPDSEQVRVCRQALPALNPDGRVTVNKVASGEAFGTIRIDYEVASAGRPVLERFALCRFASEGFSTRKADLIGLATESGPLTGAALFLLKRHYLETPDAVAGDPGIGRAAATVPETSPALAYGAQQALVALPKAGIYALLAASYALVFGLAGRINLAFGEIAAVGAAAAVAGVAGAMMLGETSLGPGLALGLVAAWFAGGVWGLAGGGLAVAAVPGAQPSLIASVGLLLALMEGLRLLQGSGTIWLPPVFAHSIPVLRGGDFVVALTPISLLTGGLALMAALALVAIMRQSRFGRAWRATADDAGAAALCGIDGRGLLLATLALSGANAGLAGFLVVVQYGGLGFAEGIPFGLKALIAAVLGGLGSVPGALLGGLAVGAFEAAWSALLPIEARDIALYAALAAILALRPGGFASRGHGPEPI